MNTIYFLAQAIALITIFFGMLKFLINMGDRDNKKYIIVSIVGLLIFILLGACEKSIYTGTNIGKKELISKAELYLNEKLLDKEFNITGINSEGTVDYTVLDNNKTIKKEIKYDQYWNAKLNSSNDSDSFWFFPVFLR